MAQRRISDHIAGAMVGGGVPLAIASAFMISGITGAELGTVLKTTLVFGLVAVTVGLWRVPRVSWASRIAGLAIGCVVAFAAISANGQLLLNPIPVMVGPER